MNFDEIKQGWSSFWDSVAEGWQHLRQSASSAITRFKPSTQTNLPAKSDIDDAFFIPSMGWSMLGGDVFEDDKRIVVRIEVPGLDKNDIDIEVSGNSLVVRGEKRFEREDTEGRYRVLQCAYGSFERLVPLNTAVKADQAKASYRNGVLRVELPKVEEVKPNRLTVRIH
ncbi:MAG TPA: Hsp20/alpha crystallin family protein [Noviherbaspirillum sp.]|uniref:Hsp20/alpha crystallin family protein n=1 Tax=Noviherbaspirillum sp. TaxID=1926288 RepID=UPI002B473F85|nr:Hsp20/alpha crystallin family protein [Noviherbaspirillum sp.]HJV86705.1 Hsp20/alpha crystallin family protein [Noviherbaspirillum sp.]